MNDRLSELAAFLMTVKSTRPSTATAPPAASLAAVAATVLTACAAA